MVAGVVGMAVVVSALYCVSGTAGSVAAAKLEVASGVAAKLEIASEVVAKLEVVDVVSGAT